MHLRLSDMTEKRTGVTAKTTSSEANMETRSQTDYEHLARAVFLFRWRGAGRSSNSAARCRSAIATRGGPFRSEIHPSNLLGHPRPITTYVVVSLLHSRCWRTSSKKLNREPRDMSVAREGEKGRRVWIWALGAARIEHIGVAQGACPWQQRHCRSVLGIDVCSLDL